MSRYKLRQGDPDEPPVGSFATDESGHGWSRWPDGWWRCARCEGADYPHHLQWSWRDVLEDCTGAVRVKRAEP